MEYIRITLQEIMSLTSTAAEMGVQAYLSHIAPDSDRINQADAKRYIQRLGFKPVMISKWVEAGLLEKTKNGDGQNSAAYYSKAAIQKLLHSIKVKQLCNDQPLRVAKGTKYKLQKLTVWTE